MGIAIVDSQDLWQQDLRAQLSGRWGCDPGELFLFHRGEDFLAECANADMQLVFWALEETDPQALEQLGQFRLRNPRALLVLLCPSPVHAAEAFRLHALHYLQLPLPLEELDWVMEEFRCRVPQGRVMKLKLSGGKQILPVKNMVYAEHFNHQIHIYTTSGQELITRQSFGAFTAPFRGDPRFYQCNRGVILNLSHAKAFNGTAFLTDRGKLLTVSREKRKDARKKFQDFRQET